MLVREDSSRPARCGGVCSAPTDVTLHRVPFWMTLALSMNTCRVHVATLTIGFGWMVGRVSTSGTSGTRHTYPADRATGYYGFKITQKPAESDQV
jgi:hypothetical protein